MECILQYLDDIEDMFYASALLLERVRRVLRTLLAATLLLALQSGAFALAFVKPPLAIGVASLLTVGMLYRAAVHQSRRTAFRPSAQPIP